MYQPAAAYVTKKRMPVTGRGIARRLIRYSIVRLKVDNLLSSLQSCEFPRD